MGILDLSRPRHAALDRRLRAEPIIWLSSTRPDGRSHLVPVWFWWDGATVLMFAKPGSQKVRNLIHQPRVMFALDAADEGEDIGLFEAQVELLPPGSVDSRLPEYAAKYAALFVRIGSTPDRMAAEYSQAIRITPTKLVMS